MSTTSPTVKNDGGGQDQGQGQEVEKGGKEDAPYLTRRKRGKRQGLKHLLLLYYRFVYTHVYRHSFNFERHKRKLTKIFFREDDFVKEGTQEFKDFWKFLVKFQALEKRKAEKEGKSRKRKRTDEVSDILGVPLEADLKHGLNFQLKPREPAELLNRIPFQVAPG